MHHEEGHRIFLNFHANGVAGAASFLIISIRIRYVDDTFGAVAEQRFAALRAVGSTHNSRVILRAGQSRLSRLLMSYYRLFFTIDTRI